MTPDPWALSGALAAAAAFAAAVHPDPAQRFRSAADFVAALASLGPPEA